VRGVFPAMVNDFAPLLSANEFLTRPVVRPPFTRHSIYLLDKPNGCTQCRAKSLLFLSGEGFREAKSAARHAS